MLLGTLLHGRLSYKAASWQFVSVLVAAAAAVAAAAVAVLWP